MDKTLNLFSFLGDAYLNLYTEIPEALLADVPPTHPAGPWAYQFTIEEGATVCISKDDEIILVKQGTGEPQNVMLPSMEVGERLTFTATKQNHLRFEQVVTIIPSGNETPEWLAPNMDLFPNPAKGMVHLVLKEDLQGEALVEVYNLLGELMMTKEFHHSQKGELLSMDLSRLASGLYIIKLSTENGSYSKKVSVW